MLLSQTIARSGRRWRCAQWALAAGLVACSDSGGTDPPPDPVAAVLVAPAVVTLAVGSTVQLDAAAVSAAGDTLAGRSIAWATSAGAVSVDPSGLVTALSAGTATVTATSEGKVGNATIIVEISPDPVAAVLVAPTAAALAVGATLQLSAAAVNAAGDTLIGRSIVWATTTGAVSVTTTGLVTALSAGTATVTATSEGKVGSAAITVGGPPPINVGGTWYLVEQLTDAGMQITCHDTATVTLNQTGGTFTGSSVQTGICDTPTGPVDNAATLSVTSGAVAGTSITFNEPSYPGCHYQGTLDGDPATAATGTVTCVENPYNFSGTWAMTRTPP